MMQVYIFTDESTSVEKSSAQVMKKVNEFLAQCAGLIDVTGIHQSESQTCSSDGGEIVGSFTLTLVATVSQNDVEKVRLMHLFA